MNWTVVTTESEDKAIQYNYEQSQKHPGSTEPQPIETIEQFFQRVAHNNTVSPMVTIYQTAQNQELINSLSTVPPENLDAVLNDIETAIETGGGTVIIDSANYLFSASTAPPPRNNSVEVDQTPQNFAQINKIFFHYLDSDGNNRMNSLLALPVNTLIKMTNGINFLSVITTGTPIQRQGADGHVEIPCRFHQSGGTLVDNSVLSCTFS